MGNLIDKILDTLEKSGSLFGTFALAAIILTVIVFFLFRNAEIKQKKRVYICLTLFLLGLVFSALTAGIFSGFETGSQLVTAQIEADPLHMKLSPAIVEKLEDHIASNGGTVTDESKFQILAAAVDAYLAPPEVSDLNRSTQPPDSTAATPQKSMVEDFLFELKGCGRSQEKIKCDFWVTNKDQDEKIRLYANYLATASKTITPQGSQFIAYKVELGEYESTSYVDLNLVQEVGVAAEMSFQALPQQVDQLALIELSVSARKSGAFTVQFRNIPISNQP